MEAQGEAACWLGVGFVALRPGESEGRYEGVEFEYLDDSGILVEEDWLLHPVKDRMLSLVDTVATSDLKGFVLFGHWGVFSEFLGCFLDVGVESGQNGLNGEYSAFYA